MSSNNPIAIPLFEWTRLLDTSSAEQGKALTTGSDGSIYITGSSTSGLVVFIKYDPEGWKVTTDFFGTSSN